VIIRSSGVNARTKLHDRLLSIEKTLVQTHVVDWEP
jgi:hypothetical protein